LSWASQIPAPPPGFRLCRLDAIQDGDCLEVHYGAGDKALSLVVMRSAGRAWAYLNVCPHFSLPLNAQPNSFLIADERQVMCAYHCAIFKFEDGLCVEGPAVGMSLDAVAVRIEGGDVVVA
jgi:nitrite reductase/ring-hydroxylating ferredoxin subunit